eukprot:1672016-Pyramimonas_sp.AAC.1
MPSPRRGRFGASTPPEGEGSVVTLKWRVGEPAEPTPWRLPHLGADVVHMCKVRLVDYRGGVHEAPERRDLAGRGMLHA